MQWSTGHPVRRPPASWVNSNVNGREPGSSMGLAIQKGSFEAANSASLPNLSSINIP